MDGQVSIGGDKGLEMFKGAFASIEKYLFLEILQLDVIVPDRNTALTINTFDEAYLAVTGDMFTIAIFLSYSC